MALRRRWAFKMSVEVLQVAHDVPSVLLVVATQRGCPISMNEWEDLRGNTEPSGCQGAAKQLLAPLEIYGVRVPALLRHYSDQEWHQKFVPSAFGLVVSVYWQTQHTQSVKMPRDFERVVALSDESVPTLRGTLYKLHDAVKQSRNCPRHCNKSGERPSRRLRICWGPQVTCSLPEKTTTSLCTTPQVPQL